MKVKSIDNVNEAGMKLDGSCQPNLSSNKIYFVVGLDDQNYRLIDDINEPILYRKELFEVIDESIPSNWVRVDYDDGEYYIDPPELSVTGFYEDYFDGNAVAIKKFNRYMKLNGLISNNEKGSRGIKK